MVTGGASELLRIPAGSITARPFSVGNHRRPSRVRTPAGCAKPLHSFERIPSADPTPGWERSLATIGELVQLAFRHAGDALVRRYPQVARVVFEDSVDEIVEEPVGRRERCKPATTIAIQAAAARANPQRSVSS